MRRVGRRREISGSAAIAIVATTAHKTAMGPRLPLKIMSESGPTVREPAKPPTCHQNRNSTVALCAMSTTSWRAPGDSPRDGGTADECEWLPGTTLWTQNEKYDATHPSMPKRTT